MKKRFEILNSRKPQLPNFSFGTGAGWSYGTVNKVLIPLSPVSNLYTCPFFPGVLLKRVTSIEELLFSCNGMMYSSGNGGYKTKMLVGSTFQHALDHRFPVVDDLVPYTRFAFGFDGTLMNQFANATYDPDLQAQIPKVASSDPFLVTGQTPIADQSSLTLTNVYGVICLADAGFGSSDNELPFYDIENGFWLSNKLLLGSIAKVLSTNKTLFSGHGDGQEFVDRAVADYIINGPHRDVEVGTHIATIYSRKKPGEAHSLRFGVPRIHPVSSYLCYPTDGFPFVTANCAVSAVSTDHAMVESIARGHLLGKYAVNSEDGMFRAATFSGSDWPDVASLAISRLKEIPEVHMSPNASSQQPVYDGAGVMTSLGSTTAFEGPVPFLSAILKGPLGSPGYVEMLAAVREILSDAEKYAKDA